MSKRFGLPLASFLLIAKSVLAVSAAPYDPWVGTWTLDLPRSKFAPGYERPKSQIIVIELASETTVKFASDLTEADGKASHMEFIAGYDGKENAVKGYPLADTVSLTQPRPHYRTYVLKQNGTVVSSNDVVLWGSGLLMTITSKVVRGGETIENVSYYRKKLPQ